ncbi:MAG TPA: branched-chain amino acid aminotransferase [Balneolaceae bacterium]|nr:branched-chain amino acid aminotransferase [Balneolaceae bacterium]
MKTSGNIEIQEIEKSRIDETDLSNPGFGRIFSDHMLEVKYEDGTWQQPVIKPYGTIEITPAMHALHYGQEVFEGMKAYYTGGDSVNLFRIEKNYERMANSCRRLCIPPVSKEVFMEGVRTLVRLDSDWVPQGEDGSLYIRPLACSWDSVIAARASQTYRFYIITSPVGAYYSKPVQLLTSQKYVRAVKGGVGEAKAAGNYGGSFYPASLAHEKGFDQMLWLDAFEHKYIEEVGTMNIFFLIDNVLITPPLEGTILPGVTRDSVIKLAKSWDMSVEVRRITIDEVMEAGRDGTLQEVFGSGTAAVISPVQSICHDGEVVSVHEKQRGPVGQKLYDTIYGIQTGKKDDPFDWVESVPLTVAG